MYTLNLNLSGNLCQVGPFGSRLLNFFLTNMHVAFGLKTVYEVRCCLRGSGVGRASMLIGSLLSIVFVSSFRKRLHAGAGISP